MTREHNTAKDEYIVFSETQCVRCFTTDGIKKAMEEIGPCAVVRRITDGELSREVTSRFTPVERDEYPEADDWRPAHTRYMAHIGSFGRR